VPTEHTPPSITSAEVGALLASTLMQLPKVEVVGLTVMETTGGGVTESVAVLVPLVPANAGEALKHNTATPIGATRAHLRLVLAADLVIEVVLVDSCILGSFLVYGTAVQVTLMENDADVSVLLVGPVSARASVADCPTAALQPRPVELKSNSESQAGVVPTGFAEVNWPPTVSVCSANWLAPGLLDVPVHDDPNWQSDQAVPPSEGRALAAWTSMWPATGPLVMVTAPAELWHVPLGNPRELAVDEPPLQVPSATVAGVTVMERTTTANVAVVLPEEEEEADAGCAQGPPARAATVAETVAVPSQSRPKCRCLEQFVGFIDLTFLVLSPEACWR
jgi:hypothetical protein